MKTALLHYWLTNVRGGERVLAALCKLLPDADIFTHAYLPKKMEGLFDGRKVTESFIARLPFGRRNPQAYLPFMPMASRTFDLDGYDLVVSSESGPVKGVRKPAGARHICYCHTPMRYVWDLYGDYYRSVNFFCRPLMSASMRMLRKADLKSAEDVDCFVANSRFVADRIRRTYGRDSFVVYPPVDVDFFSAPVAPADASRLDGDKPYYVFVGAKTGYKCYEMAAAACRRMNRRLVHVGGGNRSDEELRALYAGAQALLFPGIEDFGMVAVESQAAGTPVVAYRAGGALETVKDGETGVFFDEQSVEALCGAMEECEGRKWDAVKCRDNARRFSKSAFYSQMREILDGKAGSAGRAPEILKIAIAAHKPYAMPNDDVFFPVQVGAAGKPGMGYARDDTGENISAKNANYCELTALYWAWKNLKCDYFGLFHYRRLFDIDAAGIRRLLKSTGVILPKKRYYLLETNYSHYVHAHHAADIDTTRKIIAERHPEDIRCFDAVMRMRTGHRFNMFVMRNDMLDDYCSWLFDILFELERRLDISRYSQYDARVFGFVAERLLDVWLLSRRLSHVDVPVRNTENQHWFHKILSFLARKYFFRQRDISIQPSRTRPPVA